MTQFRLVLYDQHKRRTHTIEEVSARSPEEAIIRMFMHGENEGRSPRPPAVPEDYYVVLEEKGEGRWYKVEELRAKHGRLYL